MITSKIIDFNKIGDYIMSEVNIILKIKDKYCTWSKESKRPNSYLMNKDELITYIEEKEGEDAEDSMPARLSRLEQKGLSIKSLSKEYFLNNNKAGGNGESISEEDIFIQYTIGYENKHLILKNNTINKEINNLTYVINKKWYISEKVSLFILIISVLLVVGIYFIDKYQLDQRLTFSCTSLLFYFVGIFSSSKMKIWKKRTSQIK